MRNQKLLLSLTFLFAISLVTKANDTIRITGTKHISQSETFIIPPGAVVLFDPGATLVLDGAFSAEGTTENPIRFLSANGANPGVGMIIEGQAADSEVHIKNSTFNNLIQPLRFDPFWRRSIVRIQNININNCNTEEPVIYVASPLLDLDEGEEISFQLTDLEFYNNGGNILLESVGSKGIKYQLDNMAFAENHYPGIENMGVLHMECSSPISAENISIGNVAFNRNYTGDNYSGISVGGPAEDLYVSAVYQNDPSASIHYDQNKNFRLPRLKISQTSSLDQWNNNTSMITAVDHINQQLYFRYRGDIDLVNLQDSSGTAIVHNTIVSGDSIVSAYTGKQPLYATFNNGLKLRIPARIVDSVEVEPLIDDAPGAGEEEIVEEPETIDSTRFALNFNVVKIDPLFIPFYEVGIWFGTGVYGGHDIAWKYFPIPATLEWSMGMFGEYHLSPTWTARASYYYTKISAHNVFAPGFISGSKGPTAVGNEGDEINASPDGWDVNFLTKIHMLEASMWWHPKKLGFDVFKRRVSGSMGGGLGVFHFTPYRVKYVDSVTYELYNLRKIGTEGQNFLPGKSPYSVLALNLSLGVQIRYALSSKFTLRAEGKLIFTTTDYLDDMGKGVWYGGDYDQFVDAAVENTDYTEQEIRSMVKNNSKIAPYSPRTQNNFTDYFFQLHLGLSYRL